MSRAGLVSLSDAAKELGVDRKTLARARKRQPPLPTHGKGPRGAEMVRVAEVRAWLEAQGLGQTGRQSAVVEQLREAQPVAAPGAAPAAPAPDAAKLSAEDLTDLGEVFDGLDGVERALRVRPEAVKKLSAIAAARKELADAQKKELEIAQRRGQLLDAGEVERGRVQRIMVVRQGLLGLPAKLASRLVGRAQEEIQAELDAEVDTLLRQFAEEFEKL